MNKAFSLFVALLIFSFPAFGQTDPVLFTVNGKPVQLSEFNYIYSKTNGAKADFSKASLEEYLDLYTKFKIKVAYAHDIKLDTVPALQEELAGYRRQLADSYLTDREVTDKLVKEVYERTKKDISISHILFKVEKGDTAKALKGARICLEKLAKGDSFEGLAKAISEDANTQTKGGFIGFLTAMLPDNFYELENAMYNTPVGKYSNIIKTPLGYHLVKVNAERPARGEMEIAHILVRKQKEGVDQPGAKAKIDSIYTLLKNGGNFETLAQTNSDDSYSTARGGYLGFFGIGRYEIKFEDAAFGIEKDGAFSSAFETTIGFHIIKRITRKGAETLDVAKSRLKARIQRDSRFELAKEAMVARIKSESKFTEGSAALKKFTGSLDSTFLTYAWKTSERMAAEKLFSYGAKDFTTSDFGDYLVTNANRRLSYAVNAKNNVAEMAQTMYNEYVNESALTYEETQLDKKYIDFRNLMREYEEGILLFEAIKMNVWDKPAQDSVGLEKFYNGRKDKYQWDERAQVITYSLSDSAKTQLEDIRKFAMKNAPQAVLKKFNGKKDILTFKEETIEKGKNKALATLNWKAGTVGNSEEMKADKVVNFMKIEKIIPKGTKALKEARGPVIVDYQEFLEKKWMEDLTTKYKVDIKKDVLNSIIKK